MSTHNKPAIHGHRGGAGGTQPENTLDAIKCGLRHNADGIEVDLCVTADHAIVLHHDLWIAAGGKDETPIYSLSLEHLRSIDERIPTLEECVELIFQHHNIILNLEMKSQPGKPCWTPEPEDYVALLLAKLENLSLPWQRVFLQSFDWHLMILAKQQRADLKIGLLSKKKAKEYSWIRQNGNSQRTPIKTAALPTLVKENGADVWSCDYRELTEQLQQQAHALNLEIYTWTVNRQSDIERMAALGVDVITTDYPERCRKWLYRCE